MAPTSVAEAFSMDLLARGTYKRFMFKPVHTGFSAISNDVFPTGILLLIICSCSTVCHLVTPGASRIPYPGEPDLAVD